VIGVSLFLICSSRTRAAGDVTHAGRVIDRARAGMADAQFWNT
jgi:hypothetical protein